MENFWKWVRQQFTPDYQGEIEKYLKDSTDLCDLENRMYYLQRRGLL